MPRKNGEKPKDQSMKNPLTQWNEKENQKMRPNFLVPGNTIRKSYRI